MPRLAIVGRPNVGKSSLLNALLGQERMIVDQVPGTTRDAIDTLIEYQDRQLLLIDTAGIRRRGNVEQGVEKYSVMRALRALGRADVALLVVDADEGLTAQDTHVGRLRDGSGQGRGHRRQQVGPGATQQTAMADYTTVCASASSSSTSRRWSSSRRHQQAAPEPDAGRCSARLRRSASAACPRRS